MVNVQLNPDPVQGIPQPVNEEPGAGFAVNVSCDPTGYLKVHVPVKLPPARVQLIPLELSVTLPPPLPDNTTETC